MALAIALVAMGVFSACGAIAAWLKIRRGKDAEAVALAAGLDYSDADPFDSTRPAFELFRKGDGRGAENLMWRKGDDPRQVRVFDYWYYDEHRDQRGRVTKSYHSFSCATALVGGDWPPLYIHREGLLDKVVDLALPDINFESEEFNRLFAVRCEDRKFAVTLVDPQMMELLMSTKGELGFELKGRWLLVFAQRIPPPLMPGLLGICDQFVDKIPKVVWDLYPSPFVDEKGDPKPVGDEHATLDRLLHKDDGPDRVDSDDPWEADDPYDALYPDDPNRTEYDLDGHPLPKEHEDPWGTGHAPPDDATAPSMAAPETTATPPAQKPST